MLTADCGYYLPPYKSVNIYFMKAIMAKEKNAVKTSNIKYIYAPQYASLSIQNILDFAA